MNFRSVLFAVLLLSGCQNNEEATQPSDKVNYFYLGTYTNGDSQGIYRYVLHADGTMEQTGLAVATENPSFLAYSSERDYLLAVNETGEGTVESYRVDGDSLAFISRSPSGGAHPCFVSVNENGYVLTANYTGGNVGLLKLQDNGKLTGLLDVRQHKGSGTTERQEAPHAHAARFEPSGNGIIAVDLGTNELWFYELDTESQKLQPADPATLQMAPGAGPRHVDFHPDGNRMYVINELDGTVTLVERNKSGNWEKGPTVFTLPDDFTGENTCADIHISTDGKFLYSSNRGHNSIAIFRIGENGTPEPLGHESTRGDGPRNFALSPDGKYLLVANQRTNNIVSFRRDPETGLLKFVHDVPAPVPVCILF